MALRKWEPAEGIYLSAWVDGDIALPPISPPEDHNLEGIFTRDKKEFNSKVGKTHAFFSTYCNYTRDFPVAWAADALAAGASGIQINLETRVSGYEHSVDVVQDDEHLQKWAQTAATMGCPILLRFNAEFNCPWVPWHDNPSKYIRAFRVFHDVMEQWAPNLAMMWSPGLTPVKNIPDYYPGDDYVDWVGVSLYRTHHPDGKKNNPISTKSIVADLKPIYDLYSDRFPLAFGEVGISHWCAVEGDITDWAKVQMETLVRELKENYPRVKHWNWFSFKHVCNDSNQATYNWLKPGDVIKNTSITGNPGFIECYRSLIREGNFLGVV